MCENHFSASLCDQVRVPTHENGSSVFWEFATDSYDLGFGVYFEWNVSPPTHVSIQASESSDEEDLEDEDGGGVGVEGETEAGAQIIDEQIDK